MQSKRYRPGIKPRKIGLSQLATGALGLGFVATQIVSALGDNSIRYDFLKSLPTPGQVIRTVAEVSYDGAEILSRDVLDISTQYGWDGILSTGGEEGRGPLEGFMGLDYEAGSMVLLDQTGQIRIRPDASSPIEAIATNFGEHIQSEADYYQGESTLGDASFRLTQDENPDDNIAYNVRFTTTLRGPDYTILTPWSAEIIEEDGKLSIEDIAKAADSMVLNEDLEHSSWIDAGDYEVSVAYQKPHEDGVSPDLIAIVFDTKEEKYSTYDLDEALGITGDLVLGVRAIGLGDKGLPTHVSIYTIKQGQGVDERDVTETTQPPGTTPYVPTQTGEPTDGPTPEPTITPIPTDKPIPTPTDKPIPTPTDKPKPIKTPKPKCNQGVPHKEGCDPGNSNNNQPSNDEGPNDGQGSPGRGHN